MDEHMFRAGVGESGWAGTFRVQLFTTPGARPVVVATQYPGIEGQSLTNAAEHYAALVWERLCPDEPEPPIWIECQWLDDLMLSPVRTEFAHVSRYQLTDPTWETVTPEEIDALVGHPVDLRRGDGYVAPPEPVLPVGVHQAFPVTDLPLTRPFRADCMLGRPRRTWLDRAFRREATGTWSPRSCCYYHRVDWGLVNEIGVPLVEAARAEGLRGDDLTDAVFNRAEEAGASRTVLYALHKLLCEPIVIGQGDDGAWHYTNGQHRSQAMKDAGVAQTIVVIYADDDEAGNNTLTNTLTQRTSRDG
ncbi:hypothetical protein [Catellatospora chokoriensis]|uniref:hypothetical protein n=1 Tax=Catellatospora chokoriensis TaxID=310353 RepID=UPI001780523F|nr:hypothetical protein [Catellatospora chokoriensis]